ncbi:MAG: sensor histidine kinase [Planctomycetes bacterium]|nr:sensor histidine kinase [Planctomycetota bacterium]
MESAILQIRNMSLELRPSLLDDLGLVAALRWYVDRLARRSGLAIQFLHSLLPARLGPDLETTCFRIAQEALTNVVRHARARQVRVELHGEEAELYLAIRDDGAGFDVQEAREGAARGTHLGLLGMQERVQLSGGRLEIRSAPNQGTDIQVRFPLPGPLPPDRERAREEPEDEREEEV